MNTIEGQRIRICLNGWQSHPSIVGPNTIALGEPARLSAKIYTVDRVNKNGTVTVFLSASLPKTRVRSWVKVAP